MAVQSKTVIKSYFETNDRPTQAQFVDLIDSYADFGSVGITALTGDVSASGTGSVAATINPRTVSLAKMAFGTVGQIYYCTVSGVPALLAAPTSGQVLQGVANIPTWVSAAGGGSAAWTKKTSGNFSGVSTLDIIGLTTTTRIVLTNLTFSTASELELRTSVDGVTYDSGGSDYSWVESSVNSNTSTLSTNSSNAIDSIRLNGGNNVDNAATTSFQGEITVWDPSNTARWKTIRNTGSWLYDATGTKYTFDSFGTGHRRSTSAITAVRIFPDAGTISGTYTVQELS